MKKGRVKGLGFTIWTEGERGSLPTEQLELGRSVLDLFLLQSEVIVSTSAATLFAKVNAIVVTRQQSPSIFLKWSIFQTTI